MAVYDVNTLGGVCYAMALEIVNLVLSLDDGLLHTHLFVGEVHNFSETAPRGGRLVVL